MFRFKNRQCYHAYYSVAYKFLIFLMQFPQVEGSDARQCTVAVRLSPSQSRATDALVHQQSARTCGRRAQHLLPSDLELVKWNEIFFFKVDSLVLDMNLCSFFCFL